MMINPTNNLIFSLSSEPFAPLDLIKLLPAIFLIFIYPLVLAQGRNNTLSLFNPIVAFWAITRITISVRRRPCSSLKSIEIPLFINTSQMILMFVSLSLSVYA